MSEIEPSQTGVGDVHLKFHKVSDLERLPAQPFYKRPEKSVNGMPINYKRTVPNYPYERFKNLMNRRLRGRKQITTNYLSIVLKDISNQMDIQVVSLRKEAYLGKYKQETELVTFKANNELTVKYEARYKQFEKFRNAHPDVYGRVRGQLMRDISSELHISVSALYSRKYEGRWQREHDYK